MATIDIEGVRKSFGEHAVLHGVDLAIKEGEFVVLVGPSGCGKSTLLRLIAGLERITGGTIRIDRKPVNDVPPRNRDIAMVFQSYALYPHMTVERNMNYSLKLRRTPLDKMAEAVRSAAIKLGIDPLLERKPRTLSGGQRQRVAMGRAIVRTPKAFLFDEPLSNLDARLREQMRGEIKKLHRDLGATSIYVTHDQIEAMTLADRIVAMNAGEIQQIGSPRELYDAPANLFVAGFIGSPAMNFLPVTYRTDGQRAFVEIDGHRLPVAPRPGIEDGTSATAGIRPEDIMIKATPASGDSVPGRVELVEPMGLGTVVHVAAFGCVLRTFTLERADYPVGTDVTVGPSADKVHLFSFDSGRRL